MPDILLIQPPIRDFYLTAKRTIPYGLTCIAANLIANGFSVDILDALATSKSRIRDLPAPMRYLRRYYEQPDRSPFALFYDYKHFGYSLEYIGKKAKESGAFLVGISSLFTPYFQQALDTAKTVKAYHPNCKVVLGGHHPTAMPQSAMVSAAVDFVVRGEGEEPMVQLARALSAGSRMDSIPGLVFRRQDGTLHLNPPTQMQCPDDFPLPASHLVNRQFYRRKQAGSMVIVAGRGCPMQCTYCSVGAKSYIAYRKRSVDMVMREIERAVDKSAVGFIDFEDENLSLDRRWFLKLLHAIHSRFGSDRFELRAMNGLYPPSLDGEVVRAMKAAGFRTLNLSLGSTSKTQLKRFNRSDVRGSFNRALNLTEDYDLNAVGYVICAAPFQRAADSISDLLYLAQRRVLAGVSVFYPAPGSRDFELCEKLNLLPHNFSCLRSSALPLSHTTTRKEAVTVLRLARILNFMKSLIDGKMSLPDASAAKIRINDPAARHATGKQLLGKFLADGKICGVTPDGDIFEHHISEKLSRQFLAGLASIDIRGSQ
ncbi:MAG: B12-binding domain-containing radical SAM protein [Deltaproteobacteria bacterium]|nr:B12-binding domain-containing radical SAM protein [Deltaproteobacteria bacterium]